MSLTFHWRQALRVSACLLLAFMFVATTLSDADAARKKRGSVKGGKRAVASRVLGTNDPRYAAIIMNPVTGEIYHQANADARRYPASLTKMMTLYLLFEALEQNRTSLNAHLDISEYATTMPQTNLALSAGDTIPVEIAIKALVVRSANDVAVVVGEALGGDVDHFAQMMTNKARQLGMKNTVFRNPNGLPNNGQYTTARDMAKLGIALKRDFPQYYDYFSTRQFSWNGVTYYTHNRVMLRYPGTDGIKTGYIGLSGFNVVSSVVRGGRPLVGTVMGGASGGWRDNRMIELLDASYRIIAERGAVRGQIYPDNLPLQRDPKTGKYSGKGINAKALSNFVNDDNAPTLGEEQVRAPGDGSAEDSSPSDDVAEEPTAGAPVAAATVAAPVVAATAPVPSPFEVANPATPAAPPAPAAPQKPNFIRVVSVPAKTTQPAAAPAPQAQPIQKPVIVAPAAPTAITPITPVTPAAPVVTPITAAPVKPATPPPASQAPVMQPVLTAPVAPLNQNAAWGIQVGAFSSNELATRAANDAYNLSKTTLSGARISLAGPEAGAAPVHRARLVNITEKQAKDTCKTLIAHSTPCFAFKAN